MHLAAESHVDRSISSPETFIKTNILGTYVLLNQSLRYFSNLSSTNKKSFLFHHISTDEVYGSLGDEGLFTEDTPYDPRSPYSSSKASSDHLVRAWHHTYGLPIVISNCSNNYGSFQFPEKLIPLMILNACEGKNLPLYGDGGNVRDWLHVEDHCSGIFAVLEKGRLGETYCIGGNSEKTKASVRRHLVAGTDSRKCPSSDTRGTDVNYYICNIIYYIRNMKKKENIALPSCASHY